MTDAYDLTFRHGAASRLVPRSPAAGPFLRCVVGMHQLEAGTAAQIAQGQAELLAPLLAHATASSPFWAARLHGVGDWLAVPILDRAALDAQVAAEGALRTDLAEGRVRLESTSGSSGRAVSFYRTRRAAVLTRARYALDHLEQGRDLAARLAMTRYNATTAETDRWPWPRGVHRQLDTGPGLVANHAQLSPAELAARLHAFAPRYLLTTAPVLDLLTEVWEAEPGLVPPLAQVGTFSFEVPDATREAIARLTGARIADRYSCEELGPLAFQCPAGHAAYHVAGSNALVEIVRADGSPADPGEIGRVLVTGFHNFATPLIRYELGDLAALGEGCACGHEGPTIATLWGRSRACLWLGPGRWRPFTIRARDWRAAAPLREFRVLQVEARRLAAEVTADAPLGPEELARVHALIAGRCPPDFEVAVRQVPAIDWGPGYKRLEFRSLVG